MYDKFKNMFLPESIDLGQSEKYILSIRIKPDRFMFSIHEPGFERNYCLRETTFSATDNILNNIQRTIFDLNFLTQEFKQTNVILVSRDYELVPATYFQSKHRTTLYNLAHTKKASHLLSALLDKQDIVTLYNTDKEVYEFLSRNLWNPQFHHHSFLMNKLLENKGNALGITSKMYLNFHDEVMDVFCYSGAKLLHSLTFEGEPASNQLYYILNLWDKCGFDQMKDYMYIIGQPETKLVLYLQEYINNVERMNAPSEVYLWNDEAQKAPLDLLSLAL